MTNLLKDKFKKVTWIIDCHASFDALKKALREALVLRIMDPLKGRLLLCTNASNNGYRYYHDARWQGNCL